MSTIYITSRGDAFTLDQLIQNRVCGPLHVSLMSSTQKTLTRSAYEARPVSPAASMAA